MVYKSNFIVRKSGKKTDSYYIDYAGLYTPGDIAKITGLKPGFLAEIYSGNGAAHDTALDVYYFPDIEAAQKTINTILAHIQPGNIGKAVYLTDREIQYIRQALINEGVNTIKLKNKIKDDIFKKLNDV